jgi:hypothetical protein
MARCMCSDTSLEGSACSGRCLSERVVAWPERGSRTGSRGLIEHLADLDVSAGLGASHRAGAVLGVLAEDQLQARASSVGAQVASLPCTTSSSATIAERRGCSQPKRAASLGALRLPCLGEARSRSQVLSRGTSTAARHGMILALCHSREHRLGPRELRQVDRSSEHLSPLRRLGRLPDRPPEVVGLLAAEHRRRQFAIDPQW